jgi:hypothetical protein
LAARRPEIERAALTRIYAISDPVETGDPEYIDGLRAALTAAIEYGLVAIEYGEERVPPIPAVLLTQARIAARSGVSLDTVLRRYFAGYTLLGDFLVEEVERADLPPGAELKRLLRTLAMLFDRLLGAVSEEHARESTPTPDSAEKRRREQIRRLLAGELVDVSTLAYDFEANHLGLIAQGPAAGEAVRELATALDRRLLATPSDNDIVWAWLGGGQPTTPGELERFMPSIWPAGMVLACGEPARGLEGWRHTHRQAAAALPIALRTGESSVRYADVALVASMLQDDLLTTSLRQLYLDPLSHGGDAGDVLQETLRAYFATDHNVSSTAASLGVKRHTVSKRLRAIEERLNRSLSSCRAELEAILRVARLDDKLAP